MTPTTCIDIADRVHPFMLILFPDGNDLFQTDDAPCCSARDAQELATKFSRTQSSVGSDPRGPTSQLRLGYAADILVPDTTGRLV